MADSAAPESPAATPNASAPPMADTLNEGSTPRHWRAERPSLDLRFRFSLITLLALVIFAGTVFLLLWRQQPRPPWVVTQSWRGHQGGCNTATFTPDGKHLLTSGADGSVRVWDAHSQKEILNLHIPSNVVQVQMASDGSAVAALGSDGVVRVWDGKSGEPRLGISGKTGAISAIELLPDSKRILVCEANSRVACIELKTADELNSLPAAGSRLWLAPDGKHLAVYGTSITFWDIETQTLAATVQLAGRPLMDGAFSENSAWFITFTATGPQAWNAQTGELQNVRDNHPVFPVGKVRGRFFNHDLEQYLVAIRGQAAVKRLIWESEWADVWLTKEQREPSEIPRPGVISTEFHPQNEAVVAAMADGSVLLWSWRPSSGLPHEFIFILMVIVAAELVLFSFWRDNSIILSQIYARKRKQRGPWKSPPAA